MKSFAYWLLPALLFFIGPHPSFSQAAVSGAARPEIVLQIGHVNDVTALAWSPDGKIVASASKDQSAKLWNAQTGALLYSLTTHSGPILALAFSPDGHTLYTGSQDGSVRAWEVSSGALIGALTVPNAPVTTMAVSCTDTTVLIAGAADSQPVMLWSTDRKLSSAAKVIGSLTGHLKPVHALAFSPDSKLLASGSDDGIVKYWDTEDGSLQRSLKGHAMTIHSVSFSSDNTLLADASDDGITSMWSLATGKEQHELQMNRPGDGINAVAISPNGHTVATGGAGGVRQNEYAMLWDAPAEKQTEILLGHKRSVTAVAFSPNGKTLATGSRDDTVRLWDTTTGKQVRLAGSIQNIPCIAYSPDSSLVASGSADAAARVWNVRTGELQFVLPGHAKSVSAVAFAPDGKTLATGSQDQTVRLWDPATGRALGALKGATGPVNAVAFSPDGSTIAGGSGASFVDGAIELWDAKQGTLKKTLTGESLGMVRSVAWSPDGKYLATGSGVSTEGEVRIWDAQTGALVMKEFGHAVRSVFYSADGKLLVSGSQLMDDDGNPRGDELKVWNARTQALQKTLTTQDAEGGVNGVAILPDGATIVDGSADNQVHQWNAKTGEGLQTLSGHLGPVLSIAAAPDGKTFASAGQDNTIHIWNAASDRLLATLLPLPSADNIGEADNWLALSSDGYYDASPGAPRYVQWRVGPDLFPVEAYEQTLHRPDLLRKALLGETVPVTPEGQKFAAGQAVPPAITFTNLQDGQAVTGDTLTVQLGVTAARKISHVDVFANGRPIGAKPLEIGAKPLEIGAKPLEIGAKPLEIGAKPLEVGAKAIPAGHTIGQQFQVQVPVPPAEPELTLTALAYGDDELQSREEIHLTHAAGAAVKGNLYVLSVGVSQYRNPKFNLKYAASDAGAFADLWKPQEGGLYQHVIVTRLLDDQATSTNVRAALFKLVEATSEGDTVALFFSGHGIQVNDSEYYFATQEIDPLTAASVADSALPWTALQTTLASVRAKRILMFLDACHSGNALGGQQASSERMAELLVKRAGVMVFASSRGSEYSYEVDSAQHGAFTAALMEGIGTGKADLDIGGQRDGTITAEELLAYLRARVPQLSGMRQTPSCPLLRDFGDAFPLAVVK